VNCARVHKNVGQHCSRPFAQAIVINANFAEYTVTSRSFTETTVSNVHFTETAVNNRPFTEDIIISRPFAEATVINANFTEAEVIRVTVPGYADPEIRIRFLALPDLLRSSGSGTEPTQPREHNS
jgi:hypothetical protein